MIAARFQYLGRNAFDLPVAALAAIAVAVFAFAVPGDVLADAVGATGLPSILEAARPPLGMTARAAIGLAGALLAFGLVYFLMRRLDGGPRPVREAEGEEDAPRLRRRDFHPDAPSRPILAARDLGEPAPPARASTSVWLAEPEIEAEPVAAIEPEPVFEAEPEIEIEPEPVPEPAPAPAPLREASLPELMARLERGIAARRDHRVFTRPIEPQPAPPPQVFSEPSDDRLQSAIDSLQRLASRRD